MTDKLVALKFQIKLEFGVLVFDERVKPDYFPSKKQNYLSKGENQQQTQPTWCEVWELNPGHIGWRRALALTNANGSSDNLHILQLLWSDLFFNKSTYNHVMGLPNCM